MNIQLGCGQITWGRGMREDAVLADIAEAGYDGAPWSQAMLQDGADSRQAADTIAATFDRHGLRPAPTYLGGEFWDASERDGLLARARRLAEVSAALGLSELYVCAGGFDHPMPSGRTRRQAAGHVQPADALPEDDFAVLAETLSEVARRTLEHGVRCCYHNHVGSAVETEAEIDKLFGLVSPDEVFVGFDTGHLAWGGVDVVPYCSKYGPRILTLHVKDIDPAVREQGVKGDWDYATFSERGVFTELGDGFVDFAGLLEVLDSAGFDGWLIVETDVTQLPTPLESAARSRENLRKLGV